MRIKEEFVRLLGIIREVEISRNGEVFTFFQNSWGAENGYIYVDIVSGYRQEGQQIFPNGELESTAFYFLSNGKKGGLKTHWCGIKLPLTEPTETFFLVCSNWLDEYLNEKKHDEKLEALKEEKRQEELKREELEKEPNMTLF